MKFKFFSSHRVGVALLVSVLTVGTSLSCNNVNFSSSSKSSDPVPEPPGPTPNTIPNPGPIDEEIPKDITCKVFLNNNLQSVSLTLPGASNPTVTAECTPSEVTYTWSVSKGASPVTVNGLQGAVSTPDFISHGAGVYKVTLTASAQKHNNYTNAAAPLTVTITGSNTPPAVQCSPKINGNLTSLTLTPTSTNPKITGNCQPTTASCAWTVTRSGSPVTVPGLSTCTATPDFIKQNPGTYLIYLTATLNNYTNYTSTQPLTVVVPTKPVRNVTTTKQVTTQDNDLDVQLIIDDSNSMLADNQKLASRLQGFVTDLSTAGFDWQMCATVTRAQQLTSSDPQLYWGASRLWAGVTGTTPWILKPSTANTYQVFQNTINQIGAGWAGTDDERAIKAAWWHLWNGDTRYADASGCYRKEAGLAVIVLSDEDERSVGGDLSQQYYAGEYKALEQDDLPQTYVNFVKEVFGNTKRFTVNSIIVRPGDSDCMSKQDAAGAKSHYGNKYNELSNLTNGSVGSICDLDYSNNLKYFKDRIVKDMASLPLECAPIGGTVKVTVTPAFTTTTRVENKTLFFDPKVPAGRTIKAEYQCPL
ncbi:MAG: hypothetical protein ACAH59_00955 [Pseudobdellovibrionaceae bacterium]